MTRQAHKHNQERDDLLSRLLLIPKCVYSLSRNDAAGLTGKHSQVNMGELSLRHIPDLSDISGMGDFSESSFQIPTVAHNSEDLLLADETMGFFDNANDTLNTPPLPTRLTQPPLTLAELTP